ncbi:hypothetical protein ONS95_014193 [Cadophora gregata]|uniref:uncharacterized protein n=1 Tax=Cadophora gregata TaxID=51156 RepID=UPI0026DB0742|nr:uncharacterized protein ONS95_014193 [Cadophora gregata]KAK0114709.1 hypothetical protein ONS95_014193 [Cadophora gregata]
MGCTSSREQDQERSPVPVHSAAAGKQPWGQQQPHQNQPTQPVPEPLRQHSEGLPREGPPHQTYTQLKPSQMQESTLPSLESPSPAVAGEIQNLAPPGTWPKVVRIGTTQCTVSIHTHLFTSPPNQLPCWTYISQGIATPSQPEVVLTLLRRQSENEEAFPEFPLWWMRSIYERAQSGHHLETGELVELEIGQEGAVLKFDQIKIDQNTRSWQTMSRFGSLLHGMPLNSGCFQFLNDKLPTKAHHVIALIHEETAVAKQFGVTRVLGHLGLSVRWFPYPPWIDRDRGDIVTLADQGGSVRIGMPILRLNGLNAMLIQDDIVLTIPADDEKRKVFRDYILSLPLSAGVGLDSFMLEEADSGLTWKRGQRDPMGYASNSGVMKNLNLGFLMFAPQADHDHSIMCEDGYGILIREETWKTIRDAVQNSQDLIIPLANDKRFVLQWKHTVFHNPIDGGEYTASWQTYRSSRPPKPPSTTHVDMTQIVFLVEPPPDTVDTNDLTKYIQDIQKAIEERTPVLPLPIPPGISHQGRQVVVEIELPKREGWLKMTAYPSMEGLDMMGIMGQIGPLVAPETRALTKLQLYFDLWGYDGPTAQFS